MADVWATVKGTNKKMRINQLGQIRIEKKITHSDLSKELKNAFSKEILIKANNNIGLTLDASTGKVE